MAERNLIYVDASGRKEDDGKMVYKIGLHDKSNNVSLGLKLKETEVDNINEAEKTAALYALIYIRRKALTNCHILSDNQGAVNNSRLKALLKYYDVSYSWIPREANIVADKLSKLEIAHKEEDVNILHLIRDLIEEKIDFSKIVENDDYETIQKLTEENKELKNKVDNQRKELSSLKKKRKEA